MISIACFFVIRVKYLFRGSFDFKSSFQPLFHLASKPATKVLAEASQSLLNFFPVYFSEPGIVFNIEFTRLNFQDNSKQNHCQAKKIVLECVVWRSTLIVKVIEELITQELLLISLPG